MRTVGAVTTTSDEVQQFLRSRRDRITPETARTDKGLQVTFRFTPGETDDFRKHAKAWAIPRDATWKVVTK